jgi:hypothetical protein
MKAVVFTAITGNRDRLKEDQNTTGADFVAFCDQPVASQTWDVRPASDLFTDPVRNAKAHKILPHLYFPEYEYSLWIDATLELADPVGDLVAEHLARHDVVFGRHPVHRSLEQEIEACLRETLDDPELIRRQVARYDVAPNGHGAFPLASAVLRRHTPSVERFNEAWWAEISRWSRRDQLSVQHAAARAGVEWTSFPRSPDLDQDPRRRQLGSPHFRWFSHGGSPGEPPAVSVPATPDWYRQRLQFLERVSGEREAYALDLEAELERRRRWAQEAERYALDLEAELERRRRWAQEAERYALDLEAELERRTRSAQEAERYALSLEEERQRLAELPARPAALSLDPPNG